MTYVTAQIGTKPVLPEHMKPPARVAAVRARSEEELGRLMLATVAPRVEPREYTHKRTLRERICDFLAENGPSTTREIIEGTGIMKGSASPTVAVMHKAGQICAAETGAGCRGHVWSLVEAD